MHASSSVVDLYQTPEYPLKEHDHIITLPLLVTQPPRYVFIEGEVRKPGKVEVSQAIKLAELINAAGGMTEKADQSKIEVVRHKFVDGARQQTIEVYSFQQSIDQSIMINVEETVVVRKIPHWDDRRTIKILGEVRYPGVYTISNTERLSDVLKRAGGFTDDAFLDGAVFTREEIKKFQREGLKRQLNELEMKIAYLSAMPTSAGQNPADKSALSALLLSLKEQAETTEQPGRLSITLDRDLEKLRRTSSDIVLKDKDVLYIPAKEDSILIYGEVMNPSAVVYEGAKSTDKYIELVGGLKDSADQDGVFVVHANGKAERVNTMFFIGSTTIVQPGDTIVVPPYLSMFSGMQFTKDITAIIYQLAVSTATLKTIGAF